MATGPWHYTEAERLLEPGQLDRYEPESVRDDIARAKVHAILALAAATALGAEGDGRTQPRKDAKAWFDVASECRKEAAA